MWAWRNNLSNQPQPRPDPSIRHLLAELARIDLRIHAAVDRARAAQEGDEAYRGLCITEQEVDRLLATPAGLPGWADAEPELAAALEHLESSVAEHRKASPGAVLRLDELTQRFALSAFERDALLVCLAPEIDLRYERLYAYLHDDVTRKRPSVDLVLNLLCPSLEAKLAARFAFAPRAPLVRHRLLELCNDPSRPEPPLPAAEVKVDAGVADYLLGSDQLDARLRDCTERPATTAQIEDLVTSVVVEQRLRVLAAGGARAGEVLYLQGPGGVGKRTAAEALSRERGFTELLVIDMERLPRTDADGFLLRVELAHRDAVLRGAALCWRRFDLLLADDERPRRALFLDRLGRHRGLSLLTGEADWEPGATLGEVRYSRLELPMPEPQERAALWSRWLPGDGLDQAATAELASRFRLSGGRIRDAAATARSLARRRGDEGPTPADLAAACRLHSETRLATLARKITPHYRWDDLVLPADRIAQLREIGLHVRYRGRVYGEWGFERKLALGKGVIALFSGPSGTGKTMAADVLAGELELDLYQIDLAAVVSKYIGETEKNLSRIFDEAERANAILFFDEADALFGKRSEVRDAHDRYANIEVGYLLQRMEAYRGVAILATNLAANLDQAFVRRMHFTVEFPQPDAGCRRRIWEGIWPAAMPRDPDLDLDLMTRRFEISGGHIRNIALAAAFLAAENGGCVTMDQLLHATRREYQKMGRLVIDEEVDH